MLLIYWLLRTCYALPVSSNDEDDTVGWVSDPNGRGTSGIVVSCLLTLTLCVWSAMHLNIPPKGEPVRAYILRSLKWVILGIVIPELVVLAAWRQWLSARKMGQELETIFQGQEKDGPPVRRHEWTMTHSFYAGMGGFVFDKDFLPHGEKELFRDPERLTLTASGVLLLARCGHLPDMPLHEISDKSKADGLAKALVILQAGWMVCQTIGRLIAHQPITLLEVNTLGHIFCALVIYILWWRKPKEVWSPTILRGPWTGDLAAYMYMSSRMSGKKVSGVIVLKKWQKPELSGMAWFPDAHHDSSSKTPADEWRGSLRLRPQHSMTYVPSTVLKPTTIDEAAMDVTRKSRLQACYTAIATYSPIQDLLRRDSVGDWYKIQLQQLVTKAAINWPSDHYLPGVSGELMGMALWLSSSLYGGIHIAAWSEYFPTLLEKLLWRFSATYIASSGALWFLFCVVALRWPWASQYWDRFVELRAWKIEYAILGLGATLCGSAYIFARVFLVVDAILSLRRLQIGAYDTPNWTAVFPHL